MRSRHGVLCEKTVRTLLPCDAMNSASSSVKLDMEMPFTRKGIARLRTTKTQRDSERRQGGRTTLGNTRNSTPSLTANRCTSCRRNFRRPDTHTADPAQHNTTETSSRLSFEQKSGDSGHAHCRNHRTKTVAAIVPAKLEIPLRAPTFQHRYPTQYILCDHEYTF